MHDIFISYKREDLDQARRLADALESNGWSVWWDQKLLAGEDFDDEIEKAIRAVKCVIVLWSNLSTASREVKAEAKLALRLQKLVPVALDKSELPYKFQDLHTIQLQGWNGSTSYAAFRELVKNIQAKAGKPTPRPEASAKTPKETPRSVSVESQEPWCVSATEIGINPRELMDLHYDLMNPRPKLEWDFAPVNAPQSWDPGANLFVSERTRAGFSDIPARGPAIQSAYGRITRPELQGVPKVSGWRHVSAGSRDEKKAIAQRSRVAQFALDKMPPGVEAIDYMPSQLQNLPAHLRRSAVMVLHHSFAGIGDREFKITLDALRKYDLWAGRENAAEIGRHLGWELE